MADIVIRQIEEGMTGRQVADLLYSNFLALVGAIGSGGGGDIPTADIEKGVTAYGWGDHRQAGYLKGITGGMVTGALGYTPMDEAAWTKANIKATLGIADWALAASKPAYTTKEVAEDGNLYFTDARALAALAGVTDALAGDIGANATAIGVLQGYFTNGVAKSAAKLATSRKLWGQLFNGEADVTGALTGVTDITASGTLTIGKIKIGGGVIEWDAENGGFKVTGGLWATDYLSSKGVNTGASGGGGGGSSYQRLDTWDGYTTAKDGWVLSAKLGYGLKTTQDDILRQLADISGQGTNVTFTPSLTSGTQIGTLTIDGEPVKMYAPSIPTTDIEKGVTAYGWGNHASVGYAMASALGDYQTKITSSNKLDYSLISGVPTKLSQFTNDLGLGSFAYKSSLAFADLTDKPTTISGYGITDAITTANIGSQSVLSAEKLVDARGAELVIYHSSTLYVGGGTYTSSGTHILGNDVRLRYGASAAIGLLLNSSGNVGIGTTSPQYKLDVSGSSNATTLYQNGKTLDNYYLPLGGGTITGNDLWIGASNNFQSAKALISNNTSASANYGTHIRHYYNNEYQGLLIYPNSGLYYSDNGTEYPLIHSGNIGSQSVLSAEKLVDARGAELVIYNSNTLYVGGGTYTSSGTHILGNDVRLRYGASAAIGLLLNSSGNVGIGTTNPQYKLDVSGVIHSTTGIWSDGYVSAKGQNTTSDMRLKRVLEEVTLSVDEIAAAPAFRFEWKGGAGVDVGTSAQYWEKLVPDAVKRDDAGWRMMQYGNVAMVALISLARRVKELEEQLKIKN